MYKKIMFGSLRDMRLKNFMMFAVMKQNQKMYILKKMH